MDQPLKPQPLMSHVLPGLLFILIFIAPYFILNPSKLASIIRLNGSVITASGVVAFFAAWIIGNFFDALQNIIEEDAEWWNILFYGSKQDVDRLEQQYLDYYMLDINLVLSIAFGVVLAMLFWIPSFYFGFIHYDFSWFKIFIIGFLFLSFLVATVVFWFDAHYLLVEMRALVIRKRERPTS